MGRGQVQTLRARVRIITAGVAAALTAAVLTGCSVFGLEEETALECPGESAPTSAPGEARVLLTIAEGSSGWDLTTVIYDDGTVALLDGQPDGAATNAVGVAGSASRYAGGPYTDQPGSWHSGYLLPCALTELRQRADSAMFGSPEYGRVSITDNPWTYVTYDNGASRASVEVYAFDTGYTEGLEWSERRARERLAAVTHFLEANLVSTGEAIPVSRVQVDGSADVGEGFEWPGPAPAELLGDQGCGVLTEEQATAVHEFAREPGLGEASQQLTVRALPPGVSGCR
ncbi:MAG TPA: hypothetical protein H9815_13845 [Candidatus Ruania gallistercoris]|uniref:Uncharacterized protein n=1 Tax=Candidatus Ruania gallistercoris TaxID=2838746 RepID=A0A9D2EG49_9MICO|nr:hypothetical protein [Candidatus Ruania gallistercoris]